MSPPAQQRELALDTRIFCTINTHFCLFNKHDFIRRYLLIVYAGWAFELILALFSNTELVTTDNELKAIANPANSGLSVRPMAKKLSLIHI